jgi:hypothetical protein
VDDQITVILNIIIITSSQCGYVVIIVTDDALSISGVRNGMVALIKGKMEFHRVGSLTGWQCISHHEHVCEKNLQSAIMSH